MEAVDPRWRKSSFSGNGGDCVEVGQLRDGMIVVRDTKNRNRTAHRFPSGAWRAFVVGVRSGAFTPDEPGRSQPPISPELKGCAEASRSLGNACSAPAP
jgi:hypothetical protein